MNAATACPAVVHALPAEITHRNAAGCLQALLSPSTPATGAGASFDASALQTFDSSALAVLLECRRQALARHQTFQLRNANVRLRELARVYGVDELLFAVHTP